MKRKSTHNLNAPFLLMAKKPDILTALHAFACHSNCDTSPKGKLDIRLPKTGRSTFSDA